MFTKWRKFLPEELQDITCPEPLEAIMTSVHVEKKEKRNKKRTGTAKMKTGKKAKEKKI